MTNKKIKTLEEHISHLELMLDELNAVVTQQSKEISTLDQKIKLLMVREAERELTETSSVMLSDTKPPHW